MKLLPRWVLSDKFPAFYDCESATAIEQTAKVYAAMQELINEYNGFVDNVNAEIERYENSTDEDIETFKVAIRQEFEDFINVVELKLESQDEKIANFFEYIKKSLSENIEEIISNMADNGELNDAILSALLDAPVSVAKISNLTEITFDNVQDLINKNNKIDIDVDLDIGDKTLVVGSNKEVFSSNNSKIVGNKTVLHLLGEVAETSTVLTYTDYNAGTFTGDLVKDKQYFVRSDFNACTFTYPHYVGNGTGDTTACYTGDFPVITAIEGGTFRQDRDWYIKKSVMFTTARVFQYNPVINTHLHNLTIVSNSDTWNVYAVVFEACKNSSFKNCSVTKAYGRCLQLLLCDGCEVANSSFNVINEEFSSGAHHHNNVLVASSSLRCSLTNNNVFGSQPIDITVSSKYLTVCGFITVNGNDIRGKQTGITCHPGTYRCAIHSNQIYSTGDGIGLRGTLHEAYNNTLWYEGTETGNFAFSSSEGCMCHNIHNNIMHRFPIAYYIHEGTDNPLSTGTGAFVKFNNNIIYFASCLLRINNDTTTGNFGYYADINNNTLSRNGSIDSNVGLIKVSGAYTGILQYINCLNTNLIGYVMSNAVVQLANGTLRRSLIDINAIGSTVDLTKTGVGAATDIYLNVKGCNVATLATGDKLPPIPVINESGV